MFSFKYALLVVACLILTASASPIELADFYEPQQAVLEYQYEPVLIRQIRSPYGDSYDLNLNTEFRPVTPRQRRSPENGNINVSGSQGPNGREVFGAYTHNLYSSNDGRGTIDAYAQGTHNFDSHRNGFSGGVVGSWRF